MEFDSNGLTIGAAVPCHKIYQNSKIAEAYPGLIDSASLIGGTQIQGRASLGGNLCNAAPSAAAIPTLIVLGATASIHSLNDSREVPISEFCTGPGSTILNTNEIVVSINIPSPKQNSGAHYMRFIPRNEMDIAVVGVGTSVELSDDGSKFKDAQVSLASVAPTPLHVTSITDYLSGKEINDENIEKAGELAKDATKPISDMRGTAEYRQHLCTVLTKRSLKQSIERAKEN